MIEFKNKIFISEWGVPKKSAFAKHYKVGHAEYDIYGKYWEVGEGINFDKFWFREVK